MNYTKMTKQFVCKMAMPLALMFAACSDNGNSVVKGDDHSITPLGGSAEETGVVAYENISLRGRAYYAHAPEGQTSSDEIAVSAPPSVFLYGGEARLSELDTVTLEPLNDTSFTTSICTMEPGTLTGEMTNPCDEGMATGSFRFKNITLKSPVVLIEAVAGDVSLKMIVDIRDSGYYAIDAMSHLAYYRIMNLVASGSSFAAAKTQAESEIMSAFAFDESPAVRQAALSEGVPYALLGKIGQEFGATGSAVGLSDSTKSALEESIEGLRVFAILEFPSIAFERLGDSSALYYQECLQKKSYYANLLAAVFGQGTCSAEKEGTFADISGDFFELECLSGSWDFVPRKRGGVVVNHAFGTMTDSRDGKTYKTVTIDMDGTSQTWMAENLKYEAEGSECYKEETFKGEKSYCAYGRLYSFLSMLDSTYFKFTTEEGCVSVKTDEYLAESLTAEENPDTSSLIESAQKWAREECSYLFEEDGYSDDLENVKWDLIADSLDVLEFNVCPDGWHVARYEDWDALFSFLRNRFGVEPGKEINLLRSSYGNPTGFGFDLVGDIRGIYGAYRIKTRMLKYLFTPTLLPENSRNPEYVYSTNAKVFGSISFLVSVGITQAYRYFDLGFGYDSAGGVGFVRCVKDE